MNSLSHTSIIFNVTLSPATPVFEQHTMRRACGFRAPAAARPQALAVASLPALMRRPLRAVTHRAASSSYRPASRFVPQPPRRFYASELTPYGHGDLVPGAGGPRTSLGTGIGSACILGEPLHCCAGVHVVATLRLL